MYVITYVRGVSRVMDARHGQRRRKMRTTYKHQEMRLWSKTIKTNRIERKSNERVLYEIGEKRSLVSNMMERKIKWIGRLIRNDGFLNNIFEGRITRRRPSGRPRAN